MALVFFIAHQMAQQGLAPFFKALLVKTFQFIGSSYEVIPINDNMHDITFKGLSI
jgi:DNA polymerase III epsilon subunit-like protein